MATAKRTPAERPKPLPGRATEPVAEAAPDAISTRIGDAEETATPARAAPQPDGPSARPAADGPATPPSPGADVADVPLPLQMMRMWLSLWTLPLRLMAGMPPRLP